MSAERDRQAHDVEPVPKVCGIETEYGIVCRGVEMSAVAASTLLVSAHSAATPDAPGAIWDFSDETPGADARGASAATGFVVPTDQQTMNTVLTNGARFYVDHAHPEISTPECVRPSQVVLYDRAAEEIVREAMEAAGRLVPGAELIAYKNNSDGKGNSYGCHENYLVSRNLPFGRLARQISLHFVSRQVFTGAGKLGLERDGSGSDGETAGVYQLSQRADFFEEPVGLETTIRRPVVNTRDEPHCDPEKYRRLHVIVGDANMSETATFLKVGTTALVLAAIETGAVPSDLALADPVAEMKLVSRDPSLGHTVETTDGRRMTALELQWTLLEACDKMLRNCDVDPLGGEGEEILGLWGEVLTMLETDSPVLREIVDWVAKWRLIEGYAARHGLDEASPRLKAIDLQYHDLRLDRCLSLRAGLRVVADPGAVREAVSAPPIETRAWFRGEVLRRWPESVVAANWDSVVIDTGGETLLRIPMMEPLRGSRDAVGSLLARCTTAADMVAALGAEPAHPWSEPGW
jgi:proteasome accessory factor A